MNYDKYIQGYFKKNFKGVLVGVSKEDKTEKGVLLSDIANWLEYGIRIVPRSKQNLSKLTTRYTKSNYFSSYRLGGLKLMLSKRTPPRPFIKMTVDKILKNKNKFINYYLSGDLGKEVVKAIRETMDKGKFKRLKPSTIANRKARGNNSIQPTVDTGTLKNSIRFINEY